jgi:hypothetical protein
MVRNNSVLSDSCSVVLDGVEHLVQIDDDAVSGFEPKRTLATVPLAATGKRDGSIVRSPRH